MLNWLSKLSKFFKEPLPQPLIDAFLQVLQLLFLPSVVAGSPQIPSLFLYGLTAAYCTFFFQYGHLEDTIIAS